MGAIHCIEDYRAYVICCVCSIVPPTPACLEELDSQMCKAMQGRKLT